MSYIVKSGTTEATWNADKPIPSGWVRYDGDLPRDPIWDDALQNVREKRQAEKDADTAARQAVEADLQDLRDRFAAAVTRLDDIVTNGGAYTNAQVRAAVVDMAQIQRFMLRAMRRLL